MNCLRSIVCSWKTAESEKFCALSIYHKGEESMRRKTLSFLAVAAFAAAGLASPAMGASAKVIQAAKKEGTVTVYHSMGRGPLKAMAKRYERNTGSR